MYCSTASQASLAFRKWHLTQQSLTKIKLLYGTTVAKHSHSEVSGDQNEWPGLNKTHRRCSPSEDFSEHLSLKTQIPALITTKTDSVLGSKGGTLNLCAGRDRTLTKLNLSYSILKSPYSALKSTAYLLDPPDHHSEHYQQDGILAYGVLNNSFKVSIVWLASLFVVICAKMPSGSKPNLRASSAI